MSIPVAEIKQILMDKGVEFLYHANTVATSGTFFQQGGLMSRGAIEDRGLTQTPQQTDNDDKRLGVFYDIFFDSEDIHVQAKNVNYYGPITFVYSIDILDILNDKEVKVTKDNPKRWGKERTECERYFTEVIPMKSEYHKGSFQQHVTICDMHEPLPFSPYLAKVLIENPNIENTKYFDEALCFIKEHLKLDVPLEIRQCPDDCKCQSKYQNSKEGFTYHRFKIKP